MTSRWQSRSVGSFPDTLSSHPRVERLYRSSQRAFQELIKVGLVEDTGYKIYSAQAAGCAPIINALQKGTDEINPVKPNTIANSIAIGNPADGYYVLQAIRETGGWGESVTDEEILEGIHPFGPNRRNIYRACCGYRSGCNQEAHPKWQNSPEGVYRHQRYRQRLQNSGSRRPKGRKAINDHRHFGKLRRNSTNTLTRRQLPSRKLCKSVSALLYFLQGSWQEFILVSSHR